MRNCFIEAETVKKPLAQEGEWIEIRKKLNNGEKRLQDELGIIHKQVGDKVIRVIDWGLYEMLRAELWIIRWHLHDKDGNVPPLGIDSIKALDPDVFEEINNIIFKHSQEIEEAKKVILNQTKDGQGSTQKSQ